MLIIEGKWRIFSYLLLLYHLPRSHFPFPRFSVNPVPPPLPDRSRAVSFVHYSDFNFLFHFKNSALKKLNDAVLSVRPSVGAINRAAGYNGGDPRLTNRAGTSRFTELGGLHEQLFLYRHVKKANERLCDPACLLPLAAGASSRNLAITSFTFLYLRCVL